WKGVLMRAFWWFKDHEIAGMARPGFNSTPWFDFPYDEAILLGWIGQFSSGSTPFADFHYHVKTYGSKIRSFYKLDDQTADNKIRLLLDQNGILDIANKIIERSSLLEHVEVADSQLHFRFNQNRLKSEIEFLKNQNIQLIISLTERHHDKEKLDEYFNTVPFSINDLGAPSFDQVEKLANVLQSAKKNQTRVAVHCLAGIGRTSTMLIGAHILMGEKLDNLKSQIFKRNPSFVFTGKQGEFLLSLAERYGS
ncbi:MAG: phosphatase domain-containing putative toxin, partial [Pseudobdellovibrionaceae bacterium]